MNNLEYKPDAPLENNAHGDVHVYDNGGRAVWLAGNYQIWYTLPRTMTSVQFHGFLGLYGYDDVVDAIMNASKNNGDLDLYAELRGYLYGAGKFDLDAVIEILGRSEVSSMVPDVVDVSKETILTRWFDYLIHKTDLVPEEK